MLPSISSGHFGIASKPVYGSNSVHGISIVNKPLQDSFDEEDDRSEQCPSLPLISEGSFSSLISKKSGQSLEKCRGRGNKDDKRNRPDPPDSSQLEQYNALFAHALTSLSFLKEMVMITSSRADPDMQSGGLKMTQLQLNCELKSADRGWCPQGLNPRFANSSRPSQLPTMGLHMMSTSDRLLLQQTLVQPVEILHRRARQTTVDKNGYLTTLGGQSVLSNRYRMPAINSLVSPVKEVPTVASHVSESTTVNLHSKGASKPAGVAIHSRCCCRHHKQDYEQRTTLKSRSSGSLRTTKERVYNLGKKEGVKSTDRPPPKKLLTPNGFVVSQPKRKSKKILNVLASDSSPSLKLQEERKQVKKTTPKQTKQKYPKPPEQKSTETVPTARGPGENPEERIPTTSSHKESQEELLIYLESAKESCDNDVRKEADELMDVEYNYEVKELEKELDNREQPDSLDVRSVRSSTACDPQRSATPRLLKVTSLLQTDPALSQVFRKLDTDCDGHISFSELKKSLPPHLTRQQMNYLKKVYDIACESTYFGLEEFVATHQMCDLLAQSSPLVSNALSNMESSAMDTWLSTFMESFSKADKDQSGIINVQSLENMLSSIIDVHPNSFLIQKILGNLGKSKGDTFSGVELLAFIPYFVAVAPKDA